LRSALCETDDSANFYLPVREDTHGSRSNKARGSDQDTAWRASASNPNRLLFDTPIKDAGRSIAGKHSAKHGGPSRKAGGSDPIKCGCKR
jgi:hypothetical protein